MDSVSISTVKSFDFLSGNFLYLWPIAQSQHRDTTLSSYYFSWSSAIECSRMRVRKLCGLHFIKFAKLRFRFADGLCDSPHEEANLSRYWKHCNRFTSWWQFKDLWFGWFEFVWYIYVPVSNNFHFVHSQEFFIVLAYNCFLFCLS